VALRLPFCVYGQTGASKVDEARTAISQAFVAVSAAEKAGANVTSLVAGLNEAGGFLAQADVALREGMIGNATSLAERCVSLIDGVVDEAGNLKGQAESERLSRLMWAASLSSVALAVLFVASLFCWRFLKGRYAERVLDMKPEEVSES